KLTLIEANALKFDISSLYDNHPMRIVGNLPYNISTPLIFHLLGHADRILDMHFMLQREVVERMVASPGDRAYGRLSVMLQYRCQVDLLFLVPPTAFRPPPKVESAIVRLAPYTHLPYACRNESRLHQVVTQAFGQRRKTLRNALRDEVPDHAWVDLNLSAGARPETLTVEDYVRLVNWLEQHGTA
ncbi:MAG: 16S rRNA (adenine(1518)-N(6)/adenine(1519)-N(6))-dimethyltransferase RsmA, partial [Pseudomonadales bacterium]|nr:16S rRNA (adenine(1518)-N(6)/adenine(1519)-N(6))-dimethyltransferase RsmA [Pseudomonadales bacterium]